MRISFVTATPQTVQDGSGTFVASSGLARALKRLGHQVRIVCPPRFRGSFGYTVSRFRFNWSLEPTVFQDDDVVVGWDMDGYRLAGRIRPPFVAYVHGLLADEARFERGAVRASMRLQARAERTSVQRAERVLTVSEHSGERLSVLYGVPRDRIRIVPPAFDGQAWQAALARAPRPIDGPLVLSVARLYPRKNLASLVRAARLVRDREPRVRFRIVGDGPERRRLEALVRSLDLEQTVHIVGQLDYDSLVSSYASCDVFCLPSRQEGFGLVFLEAMAAGKPVVACRDTAAQELVTDGLNGLLVDPADDGALADALLRLVGDEGLRTRLGAAGRPRVDAYDPETIARRFVRVLGTEVA